MFKVIIFLYPKIKIEINTKHYFMAYCCKIMLNNGLRCITIFPQHICHVWNPKCRFHSFWESKCFIFKLDLLQDPREHKVSFFWLLVLGFSSQDLCILRTLSNLFFWPKTVNGVLGIYSLFTSVGFPHAPFYMKVSDA